MEEDFGRVGCAETGSRASTEPQSSQGLGPSGFDPARDEVSGLIEELLSVSQRPETSALNRSMMQAAAAHLSRLSLERGRECGQAET